MPLQEILARARTAQVTETAFQNVLVNTMLQCYIQENKPALKELHEAIQMGGCMLSAAQGKKSRSAAFEGQKILRAIYRQAHDGSLNKKHFRAAYANATGYRVINIQ